MADAVKDDTGASGARKPFDAPMGLNDALVRLTADISDEEAATTLGLSSVSDNPVAGLPWRRREAAL